MMLLIWKVLTDATNIKRKSIKADKRAPHYKHTKRGHDVNSETSGLSWQTVEKTA